MKNFSIAGLQLNLASFDNRELLTTKIKSTVSRYPWVNMVVVSELAVGGPSRAKKFSLENNLKHFSKLASAHDIWLIPGSFYHHDKKGITKAINLMSFVLVSVFSFTKPIEIK